jgi:hypothetical protein
MKKIFNLCTACAFICTMISCETNDTIQDLSTPGLFTPNVYFLPIDPIAASGSTIETEVEYWSEDDDFVSIELLQTVFLDDKVSISLADVSYSYTYENRRDKLEDDVVSTIQHNFNAFVPAKNAYVITPVYQVPAEFKKTTRSSSNTTAQGLADALPEEALEDFYTKIAAALSKAQLQKILVEVDSVVSLATFETYFDGANFTTEGREKAILHLQLIGLPGLIKPDYKYEVSHRVALFFRIENGLGGINTSSARALTVN